MNDIVFCHLLNDSSGSPRVLLGAIKALTNERILGKLFVGSYGRGVLESTGIPISRYWYFRSRFRIITLLTLLLSQVLLFTALTKDRSIKKNAVIYVNTLLPFGAAIFGKITGRKVIYHVHEISIEPKILRFILCGIARLTSSVNIYVSQAHMRALPIFPTPAMCIYNALDSEFSSMASRSEYKHRRNGVFVVLMLASLRDYKGVPEFMKLASLLSYRNDIRFDLVVNDDKATIDQYFSVKKIPSQVTVHPRTAHPFEFYKGASLLLNLSRIDEWVETFGLTILEAMAFGIPVIVPPVGGPAELVTDLVEGFTVDSRDNVLLSERLLSLADNPKLAYAMSTEARSRAQDFSVQRFSLALQKLCWVA